jgi:hypothetical protein
MSGKCILVVGICQKSLTKVLEHLRKVRIGCWNMSEKSNLGAETEKSDMSACSFGLASSAQISELAIAFFAVWGGIGLDLWWIDSLTDIWNWAHGGGGSRTSGSFLSSFHVSMDTCFQVYLHAAYVYQAYMHVCKQAVIHEVHR